MKGFEEAGTGSAFLTVRLVRLRVSKNACGCSGALVYSEGPVQPDIKAATSRFNQNEGTSPSKVTDRLVSVGRRLLMGHRATLLCFGILLLMGSNLLSVIGRKTITNDEIVHIPSGYHYLVGGDFRLNPEHPSLIKMWACLPLLIIQPTPGPFARRPGQDYAAFTVNTSIDFWKANRQSFERLIFWSRVPMILLTLVLGVVIFLVGRELFGSRAGVLAVALFSLEPTMLAHGRVVHTDIAAALAYLIFFFALFKFFQAPAPSRTLWLGLAMAFSLLAKFSMVILVPIFAGALLYAVYRGPKHNPSRSRMVMQAGLAVISVLLVVNSAYYFQHSPLANPELDWIVANTPRFSVLAREILWYLSIPLPTYYVFGFFTVMAHNVAGHQTALLGDYGKLGWWYYFPVAFALKTTIPFLLLSAASLVWAVWRVLARREMKLALLVLPIAIYLAFSMTSHINIGVRHIAPVFPFLFLLGGTLLDSLLTKFRSRATVASVVLLFGLMLTEAVRVYPNYLPYTNQLTFGKANWEVLSDSNVEWGDDVKELAKYLRDRGETKIYGALSGGWGTIEMYGVEMIDYAPPDIQLSKTRYVAIGAGHLNGSTVSGGMKHENGLELTDDERQNYFAKYRKETPEAVIGNSIYLYRRKD